MDNPETKLKTIKYLNIGLIICVILSLITGILFDFIWTILFSIASGILLMVSTILMNPSKRKKKESFSEIYYPAENNKHIKRQKSITTYMIYAGSICLCLTPFSKQINGFLIQVGKTINSFANIVGFQEFPISESINLDFRNILFCISAILIISSPVVDSIIKKAKKRRYISNQSE